MIILIILIFLFIFIFYSILKTINMIKDYNNETIIDDYKKNEINYP